MVSATDVTELTIELGDHRITVKKEPPTLIQAEASPKPIMIKSESAAPVQEVARLAPVSSEPQEAQIAPAAVAPQLKVEEAPPATNGYAEITSPMVGTFYRSPSPDKPPFVDVGDRVKEGDTVCIIEAMKLMNDMPAEISGKIVRVLVENGTTVEYGQPLFLVDPKG